VRPPAHDCNWPLRIMCMSSMPASVMAADQNYLKPSIGRVIRLIARWSLLDDIIEILDVADFDAGFMCCIVAFDRQRVGAALVDGNFLRRATLRNRHAQEAGRRLAVTLGSEEKLNRVSRFVDGPIKILSLAFDADVGLVHSPAGAHRALTLPEGLIKQRRVLEHPAIEARMTSSLPAVDS
jgi:hypothetical protein